MTPPAALVCTACGAALTGRYCSSCGAPARPLSCAGCGAELSPGARFCHNCGRSARASPPPQRERLAWTLAAVVVLITVAAVAYLVGRGKVPEPTVAAMGNAGNAGEARAPRAPDISRMSPRERFDRLYDRVIRAAEARSTDTVLMFAPMALAAFEQLPEADTDARYHAAMIHVVVGELAAAKALADTIARNQPGHLFAFLIRGEAAEQANDLSSLTQSYKDFLASYDAEMKANRREYLEHRPVLEDFLNRARAAPK